MQYYLILVPNVHPRWTEAYINTQFYYQSFIYPPTDALVSFLKNNIKIYIKTQFCIVL